MEYEGILYRYAHLPLQIAWFSSEEWFTLIIAYVSAMGLDGMAWPMSFGLAFIVLKIKRSQPRGFFSEILYRLSLRDFDGYPSVHAKVFHE